MGPGEVTHIDSLSDIGSLLSEREKTHGNFDDTAAVIQGLKNVMRGSPNWGKLNPVHRESLEMMANKVGRILVGDPYYPDHWHDIAGYAQLGATS